MIITTIVMYNIFTHTANVSVMNPGRLACRKRSRKEGACRFGVFKASLDAASTHPLLRKKAKK